MLELTLNHDAAAAPFGLCRSIMLGLLAAGQIACAAAFSPLGIRSGQWSVSWLPDSDSLVYAASGATLIHPLILYPLWAALGVSSFVRRFGTTFFLCLAFIGAAIIRGRYRNYFEPSAPQIIFLFACFCLMTLGGFSLRRLGRWRLDVPGVPPKQGGAMANPSQFRLRHLFECMTLVAAVMALYRLRFPDGFPIERFAIWQPQIFRLIHEMPIAILILLPASVLPWIILESRISRRSRTFHLMAAAICWGALDYGLVWHGGFASQCTWSVVLSAQLGASMAALISAAALRTCGYRIGHADQLESSAG